MAIKIKSYTGSYYEIGLQRGRELRGLPMPEAAPGEVAFACACRREVEALHPPLLDLYEGLRKGGGFHPDRFAAYFFARKQGILRGCTNFAALPPATQGGAVIVGRNYDWVYSDRKWCELRHLQPEGAIPLLGYTHHWAGHPDCLNRAGLCILISSLPRREPEAPGVQWNLLVDAIAATCRTASEAERTIRSVYHLRSIAYLVADAGGNAFVAEAVPGDVRIRRPENGILIATNHLLGAEDATERTRRSRLRYSRAHEVLAGRAGRIDASTAREVLADHDCGICHGDHTAGEGGWGTIWSSILRPDLGRMEIAPGHPCEVPYEPVSFENIE